ncbi:mannose-1-phosphate guanylyltransferase (GDP) [Novosphingobium aromaticivorans DSM 12444]|uniref:Mannose-1-phosphate guanylyltransferase (GDP) n=1 Tax=Novosphingobium aromaticivorans (strain ATCC 700278 / DSM 12444 / CCUG 56034 / CIP 105152 / NBRC 16084 / F199) TaxID=279238 RepID=Q2GAD4_NOVAD|nr:mannose-1-phosphate guanylyltransferase [Novosphingobium aromaticivorans]ABD25189.1 mannose-1-phosphate guanylyltransferase (GDP) [Novosphingobium aromaticivorans DSM 12444]SCX86140.1 mannose-1-phosphate guanylyltransferase (GDP) [Novosphingobium aromaticivorans]
MTDTVPVVLCGGSGTRLWPRSRKQKPKPFLPLVGENTLFAQTVLRCGRDAGFSPPVVVTGAAHLAHVEEQLPDRASTRIIVEPEGRNTAAAIALAALSLPEDAVMLVCPSDHHIGDCEAFQAAAREAVALAVEGWLVSFGIVPTAPETGFGYLKQGEPIAGTVGRRVQRFVEKPDLARAMEFLASGEYAWNGGIFAFRAGTFIDELGKYRPAILAAVRDAVGRGKWDGMRFHPDAAAFSRVESESVDYAVMENTDKAAMVPAVMAWSDIGNWQALHEALDRDEHGNAVRGPAELRDCSNVLVMSDGPRVSVVGASNLVVVVDGDEVLVCTPEGAQSVGKLSGAANQ